MKIKLIAAASAMTLMSSSLFADSIKYPKSKEVFQVDNYHGVEVKDPYRWLEDDVRESNEVATWVEAQNKVTFSYLDQIKERDAIEKHLTKLWNYEKFSTPQKVGDHYFYYQNDGLQNQYVLYRVKELNGKPEVVLDPNTWSKDGTVALGGRAISPNGRYIAFGIQDGGSDWRTWKVKDLKTGKVLDDELNWVKFSGAAWAEDESGFFYSRYPEPAKGEKYQSLNKNMKVYFHKIGTKQSQDVLVHERTDKPDWGFSVEVTDDGKYLFITTWVGTDSRYRIEYKDLTKQSAKVVTLVDDFVADYQLVGNIGSTFYFKTTLNAAKGQILSVDLASFETGKTPKWQSVIAETDNVLQGANLVGGHIVASYLKDARTLVNVHQLSGEFVRTVDLPGVGSASGFAGKLEDDETFYSYSSLNTPSTVYQYNVKLGKTSKVMQPQVAFNPDNYEVNQIFYKSKDGTKVPMFIAHKKGLKLDGSNPTLLYGYGGFNVSLTPRFSPTRLAWMEMGGVYAVANIRGGGEYGEAWHKAGTKLQKQNVFDDFIGAGEYLVKKKYTQPKHLAIMGGSNGGLLVGAVSNQRPDLFGAALPAVGVMDMLRFHQFTAGRFWVDDYGSAENPEEFKALLAYSPVHNVKPGVKYPATMVTTADMDDRVVPGHSFKYIAALQKAHKGESPVLIRIDTRAGHGAGKPTSMVIREYADKWAFLLKNLDMTLPDNY